MEDLEIINCREISQKLESEGNRNYENEKPSPYQDPDSKSNIEKAEELIQNLNREICQITRGFQERVLVKNKAFDRIQRLKHEDSLLRENLALEILRLNYVQLYLDRLCFANNAYRERATKSCLPSGGGDDDHLDNHRLQFQMLHGCKSLAEEKKLIRRISASQRRGEDVCSTLEDNSYPVISETYYRARCENYKGLVDEEFLKELKQLQLRSEKAIANAAVKGKFWNSLGSKRDLKDHVKSIGNWLDKLKKEQLAIRAKIRSTEKELKAIEKVISSLDKQLTNLHRRRYEVHLCIIELKKQ